MIDLTRVLEDIAKGIVEHPDEVKVTSAVDEENENAITLTLSVAEGDMGMIIGKHGKIARAIRTVMKAAAKLADQKVTIELK